MVATTPTGGGRRVGETDGAGVDAGAPEEPPLHPVSTEAAANMAASPAPRRIRFHIRNATGDRSRRLVDDLLSGRR
jgi:hypothetical protein